MTKTLFPLTADEISADSRKSPEKERKSDQALAAEEARVEAELAKVLGEKDMLRRRARYAIWCFDNLRRNPLDMREAAPLLRKALKRAKASRNAAGTTNESKRGITQRQKQIARKLADNLLRNNKILRLPRKKSELALQVRRAWPQHETAPATNTIRHWLARAYPQK